MKLLKKPSKKANCPHRKRFDVACEIIRHRLHLEHWDAAYNLEPSDEDNERYTAYEHGRGEGRDIRITICDGFWDQPSAETQIKLLIHEHFHSLMQPYDNAAHSIKVFSHQSDRDWVQKIIDLGKEHVVDHMTGVVFELIQKEFNEL